MTAMTVILVPEKRFNFGSKTHPTLAHTPSVLVEPKLSIEHVVFDWTHPILKV
jgi:hypothetical protein